MSIHKELAFEDGICAHLDAKGWLYEHPSADRYDRNRALFTEDLVAGFRRPSQTPGPR